MPDQPGTDRERLDASELYRLHARRLERAVAARVQTSAQNVEDACSFARMQLLRHEPAIENAHGWLLTVATREAVKLHRASQRALPIPRDENWDAIEFADPTDAIGAREQLLDAHTTLCAAGLSERQIRLLALQAIGLSYTAIAARTGYTTRTVARQLLRARRQVRQARGG